MFLQFQLTRKLLALPRRRPGLNMLSPKVQLLRLLAILLVVLALHALAMMQFEELSPEDAIWLTLTSATTVGYGDLSAATLEGRIATMVLLYLMGITILAQAASMYFEYRQDTKQRMLSGEWSWNMKNHIVFLNCPEDVDERYFHDAIKGLRNSGEDAGNLPVIIVSERLRDGISQRLRDLDVVTVTKPLSDPQTLEAANVREAHTVLILSMNPHEPFSDSINFELVDRLRDLGVRGQIIAEVVRDDNRDRLRKAGANHVLRPIRAYPELITRAILAPGSEQVIETLFNSEEEECVRYEVAFERQWLDIIQTLAKADKGLPIAYESQQGHIVNNPSAKSVVDAKSLYVLVNKARMCDNREIARLLA